MVEHTSPLLRPFTLVESSVREDYIWFSSSDLVMLHDDEEVSRIEVVDGAGCM
jgi:hypothetical protein